MIELDDQTLLKKKKRREGSGRANQHIFDKYKSF